MFKITYKQVLSN